MPSFRHIWHGFVVVLIGAILWWLFGGGSPFTRPEANPIIPPGPLTELGSVPDNVRPPADIDRLVVPPPTVVGGDAPSSHDDGRDSSEGNRTASHQHANPLSQERENVDLQVPRDLGSASDYAEDPCFNPEGIVLDRQKMENLSRLVAERQDELRRLIDAEWQAIDEIRDYRLANGQYIESPLPSDRKVKDGTVVILRSTSGQPSRMIRIQYGEYAPVDVIVDDMWELVAATQQDIKSYFN